MSPIEKYFDFFRGLIDISFYKIFREEDSNYIERVKNNNPPILQKYKSNLQYWISDNCNDTILLNECIKEIKNGLFSIPKENHASYIWDKILPFALELYDYFNIQFDENGKNLNLRFGDETTESNWNKKKYGNYIIDIQNIIIKNCIGNVLDKTDYEYYIIGAFLSWRSFICKINVLCFSFDLNFTQMQIDKGMMLSNWFERSTLDILGYPYNKQIEESKLFYEYYKEVERQENLNKIHPYKNNTESLDTKIEKNIKDLKSAFNSDEDYKKAINEIVLFFNGKHNKLSKTIFIKNGNIKKLAYALGEIWRSEKNTPITFEYLTFYKRTFSIFHKQTFDKSNVFGCPLYKYSISKT